MAQWPALKVRLAELFRTKTRDEWIAFFAGTEVCFAPVLPMSEARTHPHNVAREMFVDVGGIVASRARAPLQPDRVDGAGPTREARHEHRRGAHGVGLRRRGDREVEGRRRSRVVPAEIAGTRWAGEASGFCDEVRPEPVLVRLVRLVRHRCDGDRGLRRWYGEIGIPPRRADHGHHRRRG